MDYITTLKEDKKFRVSTITAVGDVNCLLSLAHVFKCVPLDRPEGGETCFVSAKIGDLTRTWMDDEIDVNANDDDAISQTSSKMREHFSNQVTLVISMEGTKINMKAFANGKIQLTGVKRIDQGSRAIDHLVSVIGKSEHAAAMCSDPVKLHAGGHRICMINSDLDLGFPVKRDRLFSFVRESYPEMLCTYEPCNYHGVKFKYMWNSVSDGMTRGGMSRDEGVCRCGSGLCAGNGDGSEEGKCRRVTIAVFQSGKVIATGAQTMKQLEDAIRFLVEDVCNPENRHMFTLCKPK